MYNTGRWPRCHVSRRRVENGDIKVGGAFLLGLEFLSPDRREAPQLSTNYHFHSIDAENGEASFERFPFEAMLFGVRERHRFGSVLFDGNHIGLMTHFRF